MGRLILSFVFICIGTVGFSACPKASPKVAKSFLKSGDQRVNAAWLEKNLSGRKIVFPSGEFERYWDNGSYSYHSGGQKWAANSYKFYDSGMRCIGYSTPRFDLYVVNGGKLVLVNQNKERYVAKIK
ncbi:hypothetical protein J7426_24625 [Tropicibacter sp. R16_0]|uniref:hypothetical protein n=1 Tax=Tropicibacter sp. R16_0 TaxID=2821102 RepID=UPI001ADB70F6|nr:hypothetical protein [Tropicibacter sp. R16_0]MBO9453467.1 hypothetical protein [Tropicibacter sp. R16_0]